MALSETEEAALGEQPANKAITASRRKHSFFGEWEGMMRI
jgi:hypothetical protein